MLFRFNTKLSLYIPNIISKHGIDTKDFVKTAFHKNNIGKIRHIEMIPFYLNDTKYEAFVYFDKWYENKTTIMIQKDIYNTSGRYAKFIYEPFGYWLIHDLNYYNHEVNIWKG